MHIYTYIYIYVYIYIYIKPLDGLIYIPNSNGLNSSSIQKKIIRA